MNTFDEDGTQQVLPTASGEANTSDHFAADLSRWAAVEGHYPAAALLYEVQQAESCDYRQPDGAEPEDLQQSPVVVAVLYAAHQERLYQSVMVHAPARRTRRDRGMRWSPLRKTVAEGE